MKKFTITIALITATVLCVNDAKAQCSVGLFRQSTVIQQSAPLVDPCLSSSGLIAPQFGGYAPSAFGAFFGAGFNDFGSSGRFGRGEFRNRLNVRERGFGGRVGGASFRNRSSLRVR